MSWPWKFQRITAHHTVLGPDLHLTLFNTIQHCQEEENTSGSDPNPATGTVANAAPMTDTVAEPENQPVAVSVFPTFKKKQWEQRPICLGRKGTSARRRKEEGVDEAGYSKMGPS